MVQVDEFPDDFQKEFRARVMPEYGDAAFVKPPELKDCRVALISTAGVHRRGDRPFTHESGDYRIIEKDLAAEDFVMSHISTNFDRSGFQQDINVALPLDRLKELAEEGVIGSVADYHYAFMGATPPGKMKPNIEEISRTLKKDNVTAIVLCPV